MSRKHEQNLTEAELAERICAVFADLLFTLEAIAADGGCGLVVPSGENSLLLSADSLDGDDNILKLSLAKNGDWGRCVEKYAGCSGDEMVKALESLALTGKTLGRTWDAIAEAMDNN